MVLCLRRKGKQNDWYDEKFFHVSYYRLLLGFIVFLVGTKVGIAVD